MNQPTLFSTYPILQKKTVPRKALTLQERYNEWLRENPRIIDLFLKYARDVKASGLNHYGIGAITERVRWHLRVETKGDDFKINNNWRSRLARELVRRDPSLSGMFEFRTLKA
jgi:hypothetical protein